MSTNAVCDGSIRQLWKVSSGLMVSFLSMMAMTFVDRLFLSYYSTDALSAATSSGTLFWAGSFMWVTLAGIAEVFVAQYNGSKQYRKLGEPVWQMIYLSAIASIFFISLGSLGSRFFLKSTFMNQNEVEYFRWNNYFAPFLTLLTALSAFYIGQGKTTMIKWLGVIGNSVNVLLDPLLIFGYKNYIPSMGIKGAAIATGIGIVVQIFILSPMFLSRKNQERFGTNDYRFKPAAFIKCLKVGTSPAIFVMFELLGWAIFYKLMEGISSKHILVASVTQNVLTLFLFFGLGLEKGATAISGNLIGARKVGEVHRLFRSGVKLSLMFGGVVILFLGLFPDFFTELFFKNPNGSNGSHLGISPDMLQEIKVTLRVSFLMVALYLTLESVRWLLTGLLTSGGDTFYLLVVGAVSIWVFMVFPTYFFVVRLKAPIETTFYIRIFYCATAIGLLYLRFWQGKWKENRLVNPGPDAEREPAGASS
ncbi:MAG: MATE family efflux transporter [Chlamydiota bacterium]